MAKRARDTQSLGTYEWVLQSADVAVQGEAAGLDSATATVRPMGKSATQVFVGFFAGDLTGDGTKKVSVNLPDDLAAEWLENDSNPNDVAANDIGNECYAKDGRTVSMLSTGRSKAGIVLDYDATDNKVLVLSSLRNTGPAGGTTTGDGSVADRTALEGIAAASRVDGMLVLVRSDNSLWRFNAASTAASDGASKQLVVVPGAGTGRWIRADKAFALKLAIDFSLADAAVLLTVPAGMALRLTGLPFWDVVTSWTGGSSSTIGISSGTVTGYTTEGDLLGGAAGDAAAALTAGLRAGTIGPKLDTPAEVQAFVLGPADTLRYDEITSAFTAGAGFAVFPVAFHLVG